MHTPDHNTQPCASVDHVCGTLSLVRCQHRESYTLSLHVVRIGGDDTVSPIDGRAVEFGPFDTAEEIGNAVIALADRMSLVVTQSDGC